MRKLENSKEVAGRSYKEILDRFDMKIKDPRRSSSGKINTKIIKNPLQPLCDIYEIIPDYRLYEPVRFNRPIGGKIRTTRNCRFLKKS